jgi:hypothetical protein
MLTNNKSSNEYAHDIDYWWGEKDSRQTNYSSESDEEM